MYRQLKNYQTKDPRVDKLVGKICGLFAKIETIKAKAAFVNSELNAAHSSSMSVMGKLGLGGNNQASASGGQGSSFFDDTNKNSLISDIKSYITKSIRPGFGGPGSGGANA